VNRATDPTDSFDAIIHFRTGEQELLSAAVEGDMFAFTSVP
jgi:hypothetical protein